MESVRQSYAWAQTTTRRLLKVDFFRFLIVGSIGFVLTAIALRTFHIGFHFSIITATLLSSEVGLLSNFFFHENWTYNSVDHHTKPALTKFVHFHMSSWSGVVIITVLETVGVKGLKLNYLVSLVFASAITMFWNFFWTKYFIFKGTTPKVLLSPEDIVPEKKSVKKRDERFNTLVRCLAVGILTIFAGYAGSKVAAHVWHVSPRQMRGVGYACSLLMALASSIVLVYPDRLWPFAKRHTYMLLAAVCCLFFVVVSIASEAQSFHFSKTKGEAITYDEVSLLPNGYYYRANGTFFTNPEHPPLVKDIAAIPFGFLNPKQPTPLSKSALFLDDAQYQWGKLFLFQSDNNTEAMIFWARLSVLIANAVLIFLLFVSLTRIWSQRAAFIGIFFITTTELLVGHASLVTVDVMSALFTMLTLVWVGVWLKRWRAEESTRQALILASLCMAGAVCSKFSTLLLIPAVVIMVMGYGVAERKKLIGEQRRRFVFASLGIFLLALLFTIVFYAWHVRHMAGADIVAQLKTNYSTKRYPQFFLTILDDITLHFGILGRAFGELANGILKTNNRIYNGGGSVYFMGTFYGAKGAGPLYFPVLYLTKLQPMFLIIELVGFAALVRIAIKERTRNWVRQGLDHPLQVALALYAVIFAGIAIMSTLQIGIRHIFPVILATMLLTGFVADHFITKWSTDKRYGHYVPWIVGVVVVWITGSVLVSYPYYISYYNIFGGGTSNGYKIATDSNYDWGQDIKKLAAWQQTNNISNMRYDLLIDPFLPIEYYLGSSAKSYNVATDAPLPAGSYLAVSVHEYEQNIHQPGLSFNKTYAQFKNDQVARVGTTILIFKIPATIKR